MGNTTRKRAAAIAAVAAIAVGVAHATAPLSWGAQELWVRTEQGDVYYVATDPEMTLTAACVDVRGEGYWLPEAMLAEIRDVNLAATRVTYGTGFAKSDEYLADHGVFEPSLELETRPPEAGDREPTRYSFVVTDEGVPFRVRRSDVALTGKAGPPPGVVSYTRFDGGRRGYTEEHWDAIDPAKVRRAPCLPPAAPAHTYLWVDESVVEADLDRDGRVDRAQLGLRRDRVALRTTVAGVEQPLIEIPMDASRQFAICWPDEGDPTLKVQAQTEAPREALGAMPEGYEVCDTCKEIVVSGGECDPLHFYWNRTTNQLTWWRT